MSAQPKVTIARVEAWLKSEDLNYELDEDGDVLTGFENCMVSIIDRGGDFLSVATTWRGELGEVEEAALRVEVDEHNHSKYGPRAAVRATDDGAVLSADMSVVTTEGMSDAQLADFLGTAFATVLSFYAEVEENYPALVTWTEED
ncbi:type III secretion system chaperone family protein [Actinomyces howellii]|uniref:Bacterial sensory transduction regulator n=1 Tax=Actinomyces howellii TaxID=52771 RepID=A0A3S4TA17_9ACTO|nr:YbjN domain-containing protein [Actinomyces howellii]VEG28407.1 Uncharacterised protein [Actinomyces howellii]